MFCGSEIIEVSLEDDCDDEHCSGKCGVKCPFGWWKKKTHKFEKYKNENGLYQCDKCSYAIDAAHDRRRRYTFGQHLETHLEKTVPCQECDKLFGSERLLKDHVQLVHRKNLSCDQCDFKTNKPFNLKKHQQTRHSNQEPSIQCRSCDKLFLTKGQAAIHEKNSHGHKCIECDQCGKMYATRGQLNSHRRLVHEDNKADCDICGKTLKNKESLRKHLKLVHDPADTELKKTTVTWQCPECESVLTSKSQQRLHKLKQRHLEVHQPPKYNCDYCEKSFRDKVTLDGHINEHKGLTPYKCEPCNKSYPSQAGLYQHYKRSAAHRN